MSGLSAGDSGLRARTLPFEIDRETAGQEDNENDSHSQEVSEDLCFTPLSLVPNEGHIHLFLDGALVSMSYSLAKDLQVTPGVHRLQAEFVALDHGPFNPRVQAFVEFRVVP